MFDDSVLSEIKSRLDLVDLVSHYLSLKKSGKNLKGLCPFHSEKTPSFTVSPEKQIFHCFGCQENGDIFGFLMKIDGLSFPQAVEKLAERVGIQLQENPGSASEKNDLYQANRVAAWYYHQTLKHSPQAQKARDYLEARGIAAEQIDKFRLGFAPRQSGLLEALRQKKVPLGAALKVGLLREGKSDLYESFKERITFPIFNLDNKVVGLGGRVVEQNEKAKYINSIDSPIYDKSSQLYGLPLARRAIQQKGRVLLAEGYLDTITLHRFGFEESVAPLGTALTGKQIALLKRYASEFFLVFDSDPAGLKAVERSYPLFLEQEISPKVIVLPAGEDPDSYLRKEGAALFEEKIKQARNVFLFILDKVLDSLPSGVLERGAAVQKMLPYLLKSTHPLERNLWVRTLAQRLDVPETWVLEELGSQSAFPRPREGVDLAEPSFFQGMEATLLALFLKEEKTRGPILDSLAENDFLNPDLRSIARLLWSEEYRDLPAHQIATRWSDEKSKPVLMELIFQEENLKDSEKLIQDCIQKLRLRNYRNQLKEISSELRSAEAGNSPRDVFRLLEKKKTLLQQIALLKK